MTDFQQVVPGQLNLPPTDPGNPLVGPVPVLLTTTPATGPDGKQWLMLTWRTATGTFTVFGSKADCEQWHKQIRDHAGRMSGSGLFVAGNGKPGG